LSLVDAKVAAIILAAGASRRLGEPKQLVTVGGERLLDRAVRVAREAGLDPILVVLGAEAQRVERKCSLGGALVVMNPDWEEGMGSSIRVGIGALSGVQGVVVMTCDQPGLTAEHLRLLVETGWSKSVEQSAISASVYAGGLRVPAFFPESKFGCLAELAGDRGARGLLAGARPVEFSGGDLDVDTAEELEAARLRFG
jgi:CTP:molybdopterin cytidylyltransferase MocA